MAGVSVFSSSSIRLRVFWQCVVCFFVIFLERFLSLANHGEAPRTDNADAGEKSRFAKITPKKKKKQDKNNENTHRHNTKASLFFILAIATFITSVISRQSLCPSPQRIGYRVGKRERGMDLNWHAP